MNPRIFVGSSIEGEEIATAIQENLERYNFQVTVWDQDIFELSESALDSLIKALDRFDFGGAYWQRKSGESWLTEPEKAISPKTLNAGQSTGRISKVTGCFDDT